MIQKTAAQCQLINTHIFLPVCLAKIFTKIVALTPSSNGFDVSIFLSPSERVAQQVKTAPFVQGDLIGRVFVKKIKILPLGEFCNWEIFRPLDYILISGYFLN
jgi:hypothetical protein